MKKIIVASKNPVKIQTTQNAFEKMFPLEAFELEGISVESGVSDQPLSNEETLEGAINRSKNAKEEKPEAHFWVGIEGGIEEFGDDLRTFAWITILGKNGFLSRASTGDFLLPPEVAKLVKEGKELGEADDIVFKKENSKQANGAVGLLTDDVLTRTSFYETAVILALIPFKNESLYF